MIIEKKLNHSKFFKKDKEVCRMCVWLNAQHGCFFQDFSYSFRNIRPCREVSIIFFLRKIYSLSQVSWTGQYIAQTAYRTQILFLCKSERSDFLKYLLRIMHLHMY